MLEPQQTSDATSNTPAPGQETHTEEALRLPLMRNTSTDLFGFDEDEFDEPKPQRRLSRPWMAAIAAVVIVALIGGGLLIGAEHSIAPSPSRISIPPCAQARWR